MTSISSFLIHVPAPTELYTLSLHDALPISWVQKKHSGLEPILIANHKTLVDRAHLIVHQKSAAKSSADLGGKKLDMPTRSEEHTSELQSHHDLVCRLLLEKKKKNKQKKKTQ